MPNSRNVIYGRPPGPEIQRQVLWLQPFRVPFLVWSSLSIALPTSGAIMRLHNYFHVQQHVSIGMLTLFHIITKGCQELSLADFHHLSFRRMILRPAQVYKLVTFICCYAGLADYQSSVATSFKHWPIFSGLSIHNKQIQKTGGRCTPIMSF